MASTSYKVRAIYKELEDGEDLSTVDFAGSYKLLLKAKSMPAPVSAPNTVESTTMEDGAQTFEMGIKQSDAKEVTGNLEKSTWTILENLRRKELLSSSYMEQTVSVALRNMHTLHRYPLLRQTLVVSMKSVR